MTINESFLLAPWADYHYSADRRWWNYYGEMISERFQGEMYTVDKKVPEEMPNVKYVEGFNDEKGRHGLCTEYFRICNGCSSGHAAINLAYHLGYTSIVLLGFDLGGGHWFKESFRPSECRVESPYTAMSHALAQMVEDLEAEGIEVVDCSPRGKIGLPYTPVEDVL